MPFYVMTRRPSPQADSIRSSKLLAAGRSRRASSNFGSKYGVPWFCSAVSRRCCLCQALPPQAADYQRRSPPQAAGLFYDVAAGNEVSARRGRSAVATTKHLTYSVPEPG